MSGGIAQLVAVGQQDTHITGQPEVSFFRSTFKRHSNFAQSVERQVIQGNVSNNGMSTVRIERKGDLLSYVYLMPHTGTQATPIANWDTVIEKVELLIGGQVIDDQDSIFTQHIAPKALATNLSKSRFGGFFGGANSKFYPLRFFFCDSWANALPLVGLQYHDVELRITWGAAAESHTWECYANFIYLDEAERAHFASKQVDMLITQTQKNIGSSATTQELNLNHPVKFLASAKSQGAALGILGASNKLKLQINGTDIADFKYASPNFTAIPAFYNMTHADNNADEALMVYPHCLETSKSQATGTLNYSRLDSARLISSSATFADAIYAVNYNILSIVNGMGALRYSN